MELTKTAPEVTALDTKTQAKVVESLVLRGDMSGLTPVERARHYVHMCTALGLNPASQPFAYLKLNGKDVLYATRGATDQLAAMSKLTREIVDGPKLIDLGGTKLIYCVARAKHPNGREETATATVPFVDPVNVLMKCECVPLDSEALTRRGFKRHDELKLGEEVLAYDSAADRCEWVPLENVTMYPSAPVSRLSTLRGGFSFRCTPNHSWAVDTHTNAGRALAEARHIKAHYQVRIAAKATGGDHPLLPSDAAVLGWVMCDGTIKRVGNNVRMVIYQSKPDRVAEIRALLARAGAEFHEGRGQPTVREFPDGGVSECLPQHRFELSSAWSRGLLFAAGIEGPADMPRLVAHLSTDARRAMLDAMTAADGTANGTFGKKRKPGVMEAWQILCTLEGVALGKMGRSSAGDVPVQRMLTYNYVAGSNLTLTPDGEEPVWCPTTKHGTWVMRQGGRISITGNTKAKRRVTLSILGLGVLDEQELETIPDAAKGAATQVDVSLLPSPEASDDAPAEEPPAAEEPSSRAYSAFCDAIHKAPSLASVHNLYQGLVTDLGEEGADVEHFTGGDDGAGVKAYARIKALGHTLSREESAIVLRDRPFAEVLDTQSHIAPGPDALKLAARWWIDRRSDRATLEQAYQKKPWLPLVRRYSGASDAPKVKAAGAALEAALKTMEPKPPTGGGAPSPGAPTDGPAANGGAREAGGTHGNAALALDLRAHPSGDVLLAWAEKLRDTRRDGGDNGAGHVAGSYWKRRDAWKASGLHARALAIVLDELTSRGVAEAHTWLDEIGERNGYLTRPVKAAA